MHTAKIFFLFFFTLNLFAYPNISSAVKEKRLYPMGEKIYKKLCKEINSSTFKSYEGMQESIKTSKSCKSMNDKYFQALSLYLWDIKRVGKVKQEEMHISVTKDEKCPICGMYVYKYPKWATQIFYKNKHYSFDGVKDMMKYYFTHKEGIQKMLVRDYYTQKPMNAKAAFYVLGSDIYGPMGNELIAFKDQESAKTFYFDHKGTKILKYDELSLEMVQEL